jgi:hypothetical protein
MKRQLIVPAFLVMTGVLVLIGCIPLPGGYKQPDGQPRPEKHIGKLNSDKPVKIGASNLARVTEILGPPAMISPGREAVVYTYKINDVNVLSDLCFLGQRSYARRQLLLRFGPDGTLQSFKTYKHLDQLRLDLQMPLQWVSPQGPQQDH